MSNLIYTTPMGNRVRLTDQKEMTEGGSDPNWTYAGNGTSGANDGGGLYPSKIGAGTDGSFAAKFGVINYCYLGMNTARVKNWYSVGYTLQAESGNGSYYLARKGEMYENISVANRVTALNNDTVQLRRSGTDVIGEVSRDNGATWIQIFKWQNQPKTTDLYGSVKPTYISTIVGAYARNLYVAPSVDTPTGMAVNETIQGKAWDTADLSWSTTAYNTMFATGSNTWQRGTSAVSSTVAAWTLRDLDMGAAVFFNRLDVAVVGENTLPTLTIHTTPDSGYGISAGGIHAEIVGSRLYVMEYDDVADYFPPQMVVDFGANRSMVTGKEYGLELYRTDNPSQREYIARAVTVKEGKRYETLAEVTYTSSRVYTQRGVLICTVDDYSEMDPITRVESVATVEAILPFSELRPAVIDNGSTVVATIGSAFSNNFGTIQDWWASIPTNVVASARSYVGLAAKQEFIVNGGQLLFNGKTCNASFNIHLMPQAGSGYRDNPNLETTALKYNPINGAAVLLTNMPYREGCVDFQQEWFFCTGMQFLANTATDSTYVFRTNMSNGSLSLNLFQQENAFGGASNFANMFGNNAKHYGNVCILTSNVGSGGVRVWGTNTTLESWTIIATEDSNQSVNNTGLSFGDDGKSINCAVYGFKKAVGYIGGRVKHTNLSTSATEVDTTTGLSGNTFEVAEWAQSFTDNFIGRTKATLDVRPKPGAPGLYNKGKAPSAENTVAINGVRVREGTCDIGAWELQRVPASALKVTSGFANAVAGYSRTLKVEPNFALVEGESQTVTMADDLGGTFTPSTFTLNDVTKFVNVTYTPTENLGNRVITATSTGGTPVLSNGTLAMTVVAPTPATSMLLIGAPNIKLGESFTFTVATNEPLQTGETQEYTLVSQKGGTFSQSTGTLTKANQTDDIEFTPAVGGQDTITVSAVGTPSLSNAINTFTVAPRAPTFNPGLNIYEVGTGHQFTNIAAFASWVADKNLVAQQARMEVRVFANENPRVFVRAAAINKDYNITFVPAPGMGYLDLVTVGRYEYPNAGIELTISGGQWSLQRGVAIRGFRLRILDSDINMTAEVGQGAGNSSEGVRSIFENNRLLVTRTSTSHVFFGGDYGTTMVIRNNVTITTQPGMLYNVSYSSGEFVGNTFVARGAAIGNTIAFGWYQYAMTNGLFYGNVFYNCGPDPYTCPDDGPNAYRFNDNPNFAGNYTNLDLNPARVTPQIGFVVDKVKQFFVDPAADLRPFKEGALYGKGFAGMKSTSDANGSNRGFFPDAGAFQLEPATTLPIVTPTLQKLEGQKLTLEMSFLNPVTAATVLVQVDGANATPGALQQGPFPIVLTAGSGPDNSTGKVIIEGIPPGKYKEAVVTAENNGGKANSVNGFNPFAIKPVGTNATLAHYIGVADSVLMRGRPLLPIFGGQGPVLDAVPPAVTLIANNLNFIANGTMQLTADATDNRGVDKVEFFRDGAKVATVTQAPFTYSETLTSANNGTAVYTAKVFDAVGNNVTSLPATLKVKIPAANATVPVVTSIQAFPATNPYNTPYAEITFSVPMDTSADFDFPGHAYATAGERLRIRGTEWVSNSTTKMRLTFDETTDFVKHRPEWLSYTKTVIGGWRSAEGVLVESFSEFPITPPAADYQSVIFALTAGAKAVGSSVVNMAWDSGNTNFQAGSMFKVDSTGGFEPGDAAVKRINGGVYRLGAKQTGDFGNVDTFYQNTADISYVLKSVSDSPYGIFAYCDNTIDTSLTGEGIRVEVNNAGTLSFEVNSNANVASVFPTRPGTPLEVGKEYTLKIARVSDDGNASFSVHFGESTNGVITTLMHCVQYQTNTYLHIYSHFFVKLYTVNVAGPYAQVVRIGGATKYFGGEMVYPPMDLPADQASVTVNSGVTVAGTTVKAYAGVGAALTEKPGFTFNRMFVNNAGGLFKKPDNVIQATLGNTVNNVYLGLAMAAVPNVVSPIKPAEQMLVALRAPAIGQRYEVHIAGSRRTTSKVVVVAAGDVVRMRSIGGALMIEVMKGATWITVMRVTHVLARNRTDRYLFAQALVPMDSVITDVRQQ